MSTIASPLIPVETLATAGQLWEMPALLAHNWVEGMALSTAWQTAITSACSATETRTGLLARPHRRLSYSLQTSSVQENARLRSWLWRAGMARPLLPLWSDATVLTAEASGTALPCDARWRRFAAGARVAVALGDTHPDLATFEIVPLAAVADAALTTAASLSRAYPAGSWVIPLLEGDLLLEGEAELLTDDKARLSLDLVETCGPTALPALAAPVCSIYQSLPIFPCDVTWEDLALGMQRPGQASALGLSNHYELYGDRPWTQHTLSFLLPSREEAWKLLQFFDARKGRLLPFFLLSPLSDFGSCTRVADYRLAVPAQGPLLDWAWRPYLGLRLKDGTQAVRQIQSVARAEGRDVLTLTDLVPDLSAGVDRVGLAYAARFASDELEEHWVTDQVLQVQLSVLEIADRTINLTNLTNPLTGVDRTATVYR